MISDLMLYSWCVCTSEWWPKSLKEEWKTTVPEPFQPSTPANLLTPSSYMTFTLCHQTQTHSERLLSDSEHKKAWTEGQIWLKERCQDSSSPLERHPFCVSKDSPVKRPTFTNPIRFRANIKCYNLSSSPGRCCFTGRRKPHIWSQTYQKEVLKATFKSDKTQFSKTTVKVF